MAKRLMLVALFLGAIGLAGLAAPSTADARGCSRGGGYYHGGPVYSRSYYGGGFYSPYRSYYYGGPSYYGGHGFYGNRGFYGGNRGGLYIRF